MSSNMSTNLAQPRRMFLGYQQNRTHISIEAATGRSGLIGGRSRCIAARAKACPGAADRRQVYPVPVVLRGYGVAAMRHVLWRGVSAMTWGVGQGH